MKYIYIVSFHYTKGFGNAEAIINKKIDSLGTLQKVGKSIEEKRITKSSNN